MKYPESAILSGLITAINGKISGRPVFTVPPKTDTTYPYIWLSQPYMSEIGSKRGFIYRMELLIQIVHKDLSKISPMLTDIEKVCEIINNGMDITVTGYTVIEMNLINVNRTVELTETGRLDVGLVRVQIDVK